MVPCNLHSALRERSLGFKRLAPACRLVQPPVPLPFVRTSAHSLYSVMLTQQHGACVYVWRCSGSCQHDVSHTLLPPRRHMHSMKQVVNNDAATNLMCVAVDNNPRSVRVLPPATVALADQPARGILTLSPFGVLNSKGEFFVDTGLVASDVIDNEAAAHSFKQVGVGVCVCVFALCW